MDTCTCMGDSLRCSPETITALFLCVGGCLFSFFLYSFILWDFFVFSLFIFFITTLSTGYTPYKIKRLKKNLHSVQLNTHFLIHLEA